MIITVTMNPALDKTLVLNEFHPGMVNRVKSLRRDAGGKGLLVSKTIDALDGDSVALGIVGGSIGHFIRSQLNDIGIEHDFVEVDAETRTNLKIVDNASQTYTEINEPGAPVHKMTIEEVMFTLEGRVEKDDLVIFAGSLPEGAGPETYHDMIAYCHERGARCYLDCEGAALAAGIQAKPEMIKPNKYELSALCGCDPEDDIACLEEAKRLVREGVESVLLSLGSYGAIYLSEHFCLRAQGLKVPVIGRSGAGDAMTAAMALGEQRGLSPEDRLRFAVAAASAKIMIAGTQPPEKETVEELMPKVVITELTP